MLFSIVNFFKGFVEQTPTDLKTKQKQIKTGK